MLTRSYARTQSILDALCSGVSVYRRLLVNDRVYLPPDFLSSRTAGRRGGKPNRTWHFLRVLAQYQGGIFFAWPLIRPRREDSARFAIF